MCMIKGWEKRDDCWMNICSPDFVQEQKLLGVFGDPRARVVQLKRKGHIYRIIVSDLERKRPIWYGGKDRSEESLDIFYRWLEAKKAKKI
ncbi:MAG: hypothetical protein DDT42_01832 [candidate division WS2 bacterium]|uniref:Uncharacterized protein n=1 Tax=Psychracetigena formicireducens TaxID=2986056 RepID=A0A9E2BIR9_PSYF1|nr:hypothetical protein [Candidatus Psychracetigena formicireducens]